MEVRDEWMVGLKFSSVRRQLLMSNMTARVSGDLCLVCYNDRVVLGMLIYVFLGVIGNWLIQPFRYEDVSREIWS